MSEDGMARTAMIDAECVAKALIGARDVAQERRAVIAEFHGEAEEGGFRNNLLDFVSIKIYRGFDGARVANDSQQASKGKSNQSPEIAKAQAQMTQFAEIPESIWLDLSAASLVRAR
jgi:hypothetical protein